ncbi:MAG: hypothetical protein ACR2L9_06200 [Solirubrobacteraceae bacterium]
MSTAPVRKGRSVFRLRWFFPAFCVALGVIVLAAMWIGGQPGAGLFSLGVMTALGAVFLLGGRSETIRGLRGDGRDERFAMIDLKATAAAGLVVILTLIIAFLVEVAEGHSGNPYAWLAAIAGLAYTVAIVFLRWRS